MIVKCGECMGYIYWLEWMYLYGTKKIFKTLIENEILLINNTYFNVSFGFDIYLNISIGFDI